ncbi:hypothetical protein L208DRAFT_1458526 [Tricholoma matsutake]|nr:hypothetical protein L208DRAFT_1458526 [Tricholoma matsutake 945]
MPYHPAHASMHTRHPPTFPQPFLGIQSLGQGITRQVRWQRLVSASINLPQQAALPIHTRNRPSSASPFVTFATELMLY